jgi:hypothetical protein
VRDFTKELKTDLAIVIFTFNSIYTVLGMRYYISVNDNNHHSYFFRMQAIAGKWIIVDKTVPEWALKIQDTLSDSAVEHIAKNKTLNFKGNHLTEPLF